MSNLMNIDGNLNLPEDGVELTNLALVSHGDADMAGGSSGGARSSKRRKAPEKTATTEAKTDWDEIENAALHYGLSIGLRPHGIVNNDLLGHILKLRSKNSIAIKISRLPKSIKEKLSNKEEFPKPEFDGPFEPHPDKDKPKEDALILGQPVQTIQQTNQVVQPDLVGLIKSGFESVEMKLGVQSVSLGDDLKAMGSALEQKIDKEIGAVETRMVPRLETKIEKEIGAVVPRLEAKIEKEIGAVVPRLETKIEKEIGAVVPRLVRTELKLDGVASHVHPCLEQMQSKLCVIEAGINPLPHLSPFGDDLPTLSPPHGDLPQ